MANDTAASHSSESFLRNVLWGWAGVLFSLISAVFLSPYIVPHLGDERYGIWALAFSVIDYYSLVDFGFKSAVVKYVSHYRATGETELMQELVSTALTYFSIAAVIMLGGCALLVTFGIDFFNITAENRGAFQYVLVTVGIGVALGAVFNTFQATIEAHQRFDISSRIDITNSAVRVTSCFIALYLGFGIRALATCILGGQLLAYFLTYRAVKKLLPHAVFTFRKATRRAVRQLAGYGAHTFLANTSLMVMSQDAPLIIGHFLSAAWVAYYAYPWRLLLYSSDLVGRLGMVTGVKAAELMAYGDIRGIARITLVVNRYCLLLFLPIAMYLTIFGRQLLYVWINPQFELRSAPLIPFLAAGIVIAISAGYNSNAVLYGMAKQKILAHAVLIEAACSVVGLWFLVPRYGILAGAMWISALMIVSRGIYVPFRVADAVQITLREYIVGIYGKPVIIATPIAVFSWGLNRFLREPATWPAVLGQGALMCCAYAAAAYLWGLEPQHRTMIVNMALRSFRPFAKRQIA